MYLVKRVAMALSVARHPANQYVNLSRSNGQDYPVDISMVNGSVNGHHIENGELPTQPEFIPGFHDPVSFSKMKHRRIGCTDMVVSTLSIGGSGFGNVYKDLNEQSGTEALHTALKKGMNYIDTAPWYGQGKSESFLGKALKGIPRRAYFISTKVCRYEIEVHKMFNFSAERVLQSAEESLKRLNLPYVDILQVHDVEFAPSVEVIVNETLPALQELKAAGKCRYIGITGYPIGVLKEVIAKSHVKIDTVLSYCHLNLNDSTLLSELNFFQQRNLPVINASPVGMGLLHKAGPPEWHPAREETKVACRKAVEYCNSRGVDITKLAIYHGISHEEVCALCAILVLTRELHVVTSGKYTTILFTCGVHCIFPILWVNRCSLL